MDSERNEVSDMRTADQLRRLDVIRESARRWLSEDYTVTDRAGNDTVVQGQSLSYLREGLKESGFSRLPSAGRWDDFVRYDLGFRIVRARNSRGTPCNVVVE